MAFCILPIPGRGRPNENKNLQEITIEINIWNAQDGNIGHISLYIPDNYLYISFWPTENVNARNATKFVSSTTKTYIKDKHKDAEGRVEDEKIEVTLQLDISLLESKWNDMLENNQKYSLAFFNCADTLLNVLTAGNDHFITNAAVILLTTGMTGLLLSVIDPTICKLHSIKNKIEHFKLNGVFNSLTRFVKS